MNINEKQLQMLKKHNIEPVNDIDELLLSLDDKITEIGFTANYTLNDEGLKLQQLYDELYNQN